MFNMVAIILALADEKGALHNNCLIKSISLYKQYCINSNSHGHRIHLLSIDLNTINDK